jgi:Ca2+-binding RTX toxin-like protein
LTNTGTINGVVTLAGAQSTLINSGVITGNVGLSSGNDTFTDFIKIKHHGKTVIHYGTVQGTIVLGQGDNHFNGGNNAETVADSRGSDVIKFAGGDDTYLPSVFSTGDGTDSIDGGGGRDTYDFSGTNTAFVVNLGKIAHGSAPANSAFFISGITSVAVTDKVFNFEDVIGDNQSDTIYGNAAANHLVSNSGADQFFGLGGNDVLEAHGNGSQLFGGDGNDILMGFGQGVILDGGNGNDILEGGIGSGNYYGGAGADTITAGDFEGAGSITHIFHSLALSDSGPTAANRDRITNFTSGFGSHPTFGDFVDLSAIDAVPGGPVNDPSPSSARVSGATTPASCVMSGRRRRPSSRPTLTATPRSISPSRSTVTIR